jgi:hypothetical protein
MQLVVNGNYWENNHWLEDEIGIRLIEDSVEIALLREGYCDPPVLLSLEVLEWAIETLKSAPSVEATSGGDRDA